MDPPPPGAMSLDSAAIGSWGAGVFGVLDLLSIIFMAFLDTLVRSVYSVRVHDANETTAGLQQQWKKIEVV
jgi:hypothetical protein